MLCYRFWRIMMNNYYFHVWKPSCAMQPCYCVTEVCFILTHPHKKDKRKRGWTVGNHVWYTNQIHLRKTCAAIVLKLLLYASVCCRVAFFVFLLNARANKAEYIPFKGSPWLKYNDVYLTRIFAYTVSRNYTRAECVTLLHGRTGTQRARLTEAVIKTSKCLTFWRTANMSADQTPRWHATGPGRRRRRRA